MYLVTPPYFIKVLLKRSITWQINTNEKNIYITFDDGPTTNITTWILKTLEQYKVSASFFCVGNNIKKHPEVFKSIIEAGHTVGNHSYNHLSGWKCSSAQYIDNIDKCEKHIGNGLFRPPYSKITPTQIYKLRSKKYTIVLWSVLSGDFDEKITKEKCLNNVIQNTCKGSIVVFHDNLKAKNNLFYVLPQFIEHFANKGYTFKSLTKEICNNNKKSPR